MKDFIKFVFATVVGIIIFCVGGFFLSLLMLFSIAWSSDSETQVPEKSVLKLDFNGTLSERGSEGLPFAALLGDDTSNYTLRDVLSAIGKAKENESIAGIYIEADMLGTGYASLKSIRDALLDFRESGKFVVAYADNYTQGLYYLSSVADKVMLNPRGVIQWRGLSATPMFYKELLDKLGVEMQVFRVGTYKSAVEPFVATEMSDANRQQIETYLKSVWGTVTNEVAASRGLTVEQLNACADRMLMFYPAQESVTAGLADTLIYKNDVRDYLEARVGLDEDDDLSLLSLADMAGVAKNQPKDKSGNVVAVYYASGEIDGTQGEGSEYIDSEEMAADLRRLKEDEDVRAVVLRVNSPGGSAYGSEQIWYAVSELKKEKPVIVSMGDYAASGGYYLSCCADTIVAEPTTLTGSIGIFGLYPNVQGLTEKIGLDFDVVKTNRFADFGTPGRPLNADESSLMQMMVNEGYDLFLERCAQGRGMTKEEVDKVGQGRVWTGADALELGLVDELGGLDRALEIAVEKAGVEHYTLMSYPAPRPFLESLKKISPTRFMGARLLPEEASGLYRMAKQLHEMEPRERLQARLPFELNVR